MLYQTSRRRSTTTKRFLPLVPAGVACVLVVMQFEVPTFLANMAHAAAAPLWDVRDAVHAHYEDSKLADIEHDRLIDERVALTEELATLRRENYSVSILKDDNERLRKALGRAERETGLIPAAVLHDNAREPYGTMVIDVGADRGVRESMLVTTTDGAALGTVVRALDEHSVVYLFTSHSSRINALLAGSSTLSVMLEGHGAGSMEMRLPRSVHVTVGDAVLLTTFPTYPVGYVAAVQSEPEDAFHTIYVTPPMNSYSVRYVLVDTVHQVELLQPEADESAGLNQGEVTE